ncbi:hypothetical protein GGER_10850 [Serratia rubidaea]
MLIGQYYDPARRTVISSQPPPYPWHQHDDGQIYLLTHGAIALETEQRQWAMTAGTLGWLPPRCRHQAQSCGQVEGWLLFLSPATCRPLPGNARLLAASGLAQALVARIAGLPPSPLRAPQRRMVQVLLDEMQGKKKRRYSCRCRRMRGC